MASKRALITGATGFIGSHVARRLLQRGYEVHVVCRSSSRFDRLGDVRRRLRIHAVGLDDRNRLRRTVQAIAPDYILHLAGAAMHAGVACFPEQVVRTNVLGTINLIDACDAVPYAGFVNTGDAFEYGPKRRPAREGDRCRPRTLDGKTKLIATQYARYAALARHKPILTLRLFSVFGPLDHPRRLVPQVLTSALSRAPLRASRPDVARDYLYVDDVADLYLRAMTAAARLGGEILNAGSGQATTVAEVIDVVGVLARRKLAVHWGAFPLAAHDRGCWVADITRVRTLLRWEPRFALEDGLRATLRWARRQPRRGDQLPFASK